MCRFRWFVHKVYNDTLDRNLLAAGTRRNSKTKFSSFAMI